MPPEFALLELSGEGAGRQFKPVRIEDITQAMARYEALALLGEPGAGKTTMLNKLALDERDDGWRLAPGRSRAGFPG